MARKPNLPGPEDFFGGDLEKVVTQRKGKAVKRPNRKQTQARPAPTAVVKEGHARTIEPGFTEKVTFYVSPEILKRLELTRVQLLLECNLKVSRSQIVEVILGEQVGQVEHIADLLENAAEH